MRAKHLIDEPQDRNPSFGELAALGAALFSDDEAESKKAWEQLNAVSAHAKRSAPGFFTPYRSFGDFGLSLTGPVVAPLALGLVAGAAAIGAAVGTVTALGSLLVSGGAAFAGLFNENAKETASDALAIAAISGIITAVCAVVTIAMAILAAVLTPLAIASLVTRSAATLVSPVVDCFSKCHASESEEEEHGVTATI